MYMNKVSPQCNRVFLKLNYSYTTDEYVTVENTGHLEKLPRKRNSLVIYVKTNEISTAGFKSVGWFTAVEDEEAVGGVQSGETCFEEAM